MADQKINGEYLEKGIYFEAKPLFNGVGNTYHSYLVYGDSLGNAEVIRGGPEAFNELTVKSGVDISDTLDSYSNGTPIQDRIITKLDLGTQDINQVWSSAVTTANSIDPRIDYEISLSPPTTLFGLIANVVNIAINNQIILPEDAQVCHSVTGTILKEIGINVNDVLEQSNMTKVSVNGIETNLSDIAKLTNKSSIDLLEYNNMTLEEAKSLTVGEPIRIYEGDPETINTPEGNIKLFENYDGSETAILPEGITGEKITINFDEDTSTLLYGDRTNPDKITYVDEVTNNYVEILKDSNGTYYKSLELNDNFTISYDNKNTITNIQINSDIANLTPYSKDDLQAFNFLDGDTVDSNTNFGLLVLKDVGFNNKFYKNDKRKVS